MHVDVRHDQKIVWVMDGERAVASFAFEAWGGKAKAERAAHDYLSKPDDLVIERFDPSMAPKGVPVLIAGGIGKKRTGGDWVSCMGDPDDERPLNWEPKWWAHIPQEND